MSTNAVSPAQSGGSGGNQAVDSTTQPCPLTECAALISCLDGRNFAVKDLDAEVVGGPGAKPTDVQGAAEFEHLKPPDKEFTAKVTISGDNLKKYAWPGTDAAMTESVKFIAGADEVLYKFTLVCLARPKVKVLWQEDNKPIADVGVKLQQETADKYTLSTTKKDEGIAKLEDSDTGVKPGAYTVTFPTGIEHCVVVEDPGISLAEAATDMFTFHIKKFYVSFQLKDQFDKDISGLDWVLQYPDGKKKDTGKFADEHKGLVKKDQVPDGEYVFSVKLVFSPAWEYTDLEVGKDVKMSAQASGFDPGTDVKFDIFDSCVLTGAALDSVTGKTGDDPKVTLVEATWKPDADKLKTAKSGAVVFVASVDPLKATSAAAPVTGKLSFDIKDADGNALDTAVDFSFSTGTGITKVTVDSPGGKAEPEVLIGATLLSVQLGGQAGLPGSFTEDGGKAQGFVVPVTA